MTKFIFLSLILSSMAMAQEVQETIVHKAFARTSFGIKSRTIDTKDAENVLKIIANYKLSNPQTVLTGIEILTCTSDYELPQNIVTSKKVDEHIQLAKDRHMMIIEQVVKSLQLPVSGEARQCGPDYTADVLNDRFVTVQSGAIYEERFKALFQSEGFVQKLKEETLIEDPEHLKELYPTPFLARFKPFQGVRIYIKGLVKEKAEEKPKPTKIPSGRIQ